MCHFRDPRFISSKHIQPQWPSCPIEVMPSGPNPDITVREVCFQEFPGGPSWEIRLPSGDDN